MKWATILQEIHSAGPDEEYPKVAADRDILWRAAHDGPTRSLANPFVIFLRADAHSHIRLLVFDCFFNVR